MKKLRKVVSSTQIPETYEAIFGTKEISSMLDIIKEITGYDMQVEENSTGEFSILVDEKSYPIQG